MRFMKHIHRSVVSAERARVWSLVALAAVVLAPRLAAAQSGAASAPHADTALAPLLLLSVAIERFWETLFTLIENSALALGRIMDALGVPMRAARGELDAATRAFADAARLLTGEAPSEAALGGSSNRLRDAEARLDAASKRVTGLTRDPLYLSLKRAVILTGSAVLGPTLALMGGLKLFHSMGFTAMSERADMVLTGMVVGTGAGPVHDMVSALGSVRSALEGIGSIARRTPPRDAAHRHA